jgi:hypothetical protein
MYFSRYNHDDIRTQFYINFWYTKIYDYPYWLLELRHFDTFGNACRNYFGTSFGLVLIKHLEF